MIARFEITEAEIRRAVIDYIKDHIGVSVYANDVKIEVKSKQNYKSEWEEAAFRAHFMTTSVGL